MKNAARYLSLSVLGLCAAAAFPQPPGPSAAAPASAASPGAAVKPSAQSEAGEPRANTSTARVPAQPAAAQKPSNAADKLQLGTATVTGDREQPKVMYVVPWKRSDIGDLGGKPMNSLIDEILAPVDRDVFKREVSYYQTVKSEASPTGAQPASGQVEK